MKFRILTLTILLAFLFSGCSMLRKEMISLSKEDVKNVTAGRKISENLLKTWAWNEGFIRGGLGAKIGTLPQETIQAMQEIKAIAQKYNYWNDKDYDLGFAVSARFRAMSAITQETLKQYAPEIIGYLPSILKMIP